MKYTCPVCGYDNLREPPTNYSICPSCGSEFGNDDFDVTHYELRDKWLRAGAHWWSPDIAPPSNWFPLDQLWRAGLLPVIREVRLLGDAETASQSRRYQQTKIVFWFQVAGRQPLLAQPANLRGVFDSESVKLRLQP